VIPRIALAVAVTVFVIAVWMAVRALPELEETDADHRDD
jgi:hypothetical protein